MGSDWGRVSIIYQLGVEVFWKPINNLLTCYYWIYNLLRWLFIHVEYQKKEHPLPWWFSFFERSKKHPIFLKCPHICFLFVLVISIGIMEKQKTNQSRSLGSVKPAQPWALLYTKGNFRRGSKVQGPMNSSNLTGWKLQIGPKAFRPGSKTRKWQIEAKPTWHLFWRENQLVRTKKQC
jgi:hypothetical protein